MRHLMSPLDLSVEELNDLLDLASDIEANPKKYAHACDGILRTKLYNFNQKNEVFDEQESSKNEGKRNRSPLS